MLYSDGAEGSTRLLVLKLWRWRADNADPILPGLGKGLSLVSPLVLILTGRENSLTLDFSDLRGLSDWKGGKGAGGGGICEFIDAVVGEFRPDLGKTTLAAAVAADEWEFAMRSFWPAPWLQKVVSRGALASVKLNIGGLA